MNKRAVTLISACLLAGCSRNYVKEFASELHVTPAEANTTENEFTVMKPQKIVAIVNTSIVSRELFSVNATATSYAIAVESPAACLKIAKDQTTEIDPGRFGTSVVRTTECRSLVTGIRFARLVCNKVGCKPY